MIRIHIYTYLYTLALNLKKRRKENFELLGIILHVYRVVSMFIDFIHIHGRDP